jgi:hypothetical protein
MAFIDKIGEKISSGANAVTNSTKKMTETARINSEISRNSTEIEKRMKKIGICVKTRLMEQINDAEVEQIAAEIDEFIARNEQLSQELQIIKGIRKCVSCGAELDSSCVFCPSCGTKNDVVQTAAPTQKTVVQVKAVKPAHSAENETAAEAVPVEEATEAQVISEPTEPAEQVKPVEQIEQSEQVEPVINTAPTQPTAPQGIFCSNCGYRETPDALFCSNCGSKLIK